LVKITKNGLTDLCNEDAHMKWHSPNHMHFRPIHIFLED